jgi:hypothetical protein
VTVAVSTSGAATDAVASGERPEHSEVRAHWWSEGDGTASRYGDASMELIKAVAPVVATVTSP